jgi:hypothetical protein
MPAFCSEDFYPSAHIVARKQEGRCISFNGDQQQSVSLPPMDFTSLPQGFSFSFWFKHEAPSTEYTAGTRIFDFGNGRGANNIVFGKYGSSMDAIMYIFSPNGNGELSIQQGFLPYTWFHVVWVVQRATASSSCIWRLFQNGQLVSQVGGVYPTAATRLNYIGRNHWNDPWFKGKIDSFGIFQRPILQEQAALFALKGSITVSHLCYTTHSTIHGEVLLNRS